MPPARARRTWGVWPLAGGFDLAVCCDVRFASATARFAHPEFTFGAWSTRRSTISWSGALARDLCLTGREPDAQEALALRFVSQVVPREGLEGAVARVAQRIDGAPRDRLLRTKAKAIARAAINAQATLDL